jgi:hypothetical protein
MQEAILLPKKSSGKQASSLILNPSDKYTSGVTLSTDNKTATFDSNIGGAVRGTIGRSSGKWYFEVKVLTAESGTGGYTPGIGIAPSTTNLYRPWQSADELLWYSYQSNNSALLYGNAQRFTYGTVYWVGDVIGIALDATAKTIRFYRNGVAQAAFQTTTYSNGSTFYPMLSGAAAGGTNSSAQLLAGLDMIYNLPSDYSAW